MLFGGGGDREDRRGGGLAALAMMILAPLAALLIQLAVSRSREYQADETGAHLTGNPYALASALGKLDAYSRRIPMQASPSTAHLFIIQPLLGVNVGNLFSTHPPIAKRIERADWAPIGVSAGRVGQGAADISQWRDGRGRPPPHRFLKEGPVQKPGQEVEAPPRVSYRAPL